MWVRKHYMTWHNFLLCLQRNLQACSCPMQPLWFKELWEVCGSVAPKKKSQNVVEGANLAPQWDCLADELQIGDDVSPLSLFTTILQFTSMLLWQERGEQGFDDSWNTTCTVMPGNFLYSLNSQRSICVCAAISSVKLRAFQSLLGSNHVSLPCFMASFFALSLCLFVLLCSLSPKLP